MCWDEVGERELVRPELICITNKAVQKIRARMRTAQSRQKSYTDVRHRNLEFEEGDLVFLKVAPMKGIVRFRCKEKLSPCFIESFEILERNRFSSIQTSLTTFTLECTRCISCIHVKEIYYRPYARDRLQTPPDRGKLKLLGETD